jgi:5-hydroxyisourate hydrolase-like protein (transthyretin family)
MNIRSIDLQVLIPHATEVSKTQHIANQQTASQQQDFALQWQRISQDRQQQVQTVNQSEDGKVTEKKEASDKRRKQGKSKEQAQRKEDSVQPSHAPQMFSDTSLGHTIDIKT